MSGSLADTNGNSVTSNINSNSGTWKDSIGRTSLTINNDTTNHLTTYAYPDTGGVSQTWTMHYIARDVRTAFGCANTSEYAQSSIYLPSSLDLPGGNGSYTFEYETTPSYPTSTTGRISKVNLPRGGWIQYVYSGANCADGSPMQLTKTINDGTTSHSWTYTRTANGDGTWKTVVNAPSNDIELAFNANGVPTDEKIYAAALGGAVLQEVQTTYVNYTPSRTTTIAGGKSKTVDYSYDQFANRSAMYEYDWNSTTTYLRTTLNSYVTDPAYLNAGLVDLVSSQTILQGGPTGTPVSKTQYFYDKKNSDGTADNDSGNIAITCQSGAAAHDDTNYGCTSTSPRGNLTKVVQYTDAVNSAGVIKTYYGYDSLGNLLQTKDPRGNSTTVSYADNWDGTSSCSVASAFAYPTVIANALGQSQTSSYNRCTGRVVKTQDPNSQITTFTYSDSLLRPTNVGYPDGGGLGYSYTSTQTTVQVVGGTSTTTTTDGLGRTTHVQTVDGTVDYSYGYDGQGATQSVSNPHQSGSSPSTTTHYDALGRRTGVDYADGTSHSSISYVDNCSTATDAASHGRKLCTDALGRVSQVYEDPNGANYLTSYQYSGLDNLTDVVQNGGAHRLFLYDGLSRMIAANNPENTSSQQLAQLSCGTAQSWTTCYSYDNNGNLTSQTDNSNTTIAAQYDTLNRLTLKQAPGISNVYGYDTGSWVHNGIGRLVWATNSSTADEIFSYDSMGRLNWQSSWRPSSPNHSDNIMTAVYDSAGNMTDLTYPDGRHVHQTWNAGHLSQVNYADLNGTAVNYPYVSSASYMPDGSPQSMTLGNGVQISYGKNSRGQLSSITATNPQQPFNGQTFLSKQYCYTPDCSMSMGNNGNVVHIQNTLNSGKTQTYGYDSLNRIASAQTSDLSINQSFNIDAWGNMSANGTPSSQYLFNGLNQISANSFSYDPAGRLTTINLGAGNTTYGYDADGHMVNVNGGSTASYAYDAVGQRARKDGGGDWTEYTYFNGQPVAEKHADGSWSDYIFANGQRIARADSYDARLHLSGVNCDSSQCGNRSSAANLPTGSGYVVQNGDVLHFRQYQSGSAQGGLMIGFTDGTGTNWYAVDRDGQQLNNDGYKNIWHERTQDMSAYAGKTISGIAILNEVTSGTGQFDLYFGDISITSTTGKVLTVYNRQQGLSLSPYAMFNTAGVTNLTAVQENPQWYLTAQENNTNYYVADHLGTARMELAGGGWPVWSGEFAPYGQEINPQPTPNHYKFTGQERDSETWLDTFQFRSLNSTMGRWMSPDPYLGSMDITNPQSLNRYSYVGNSPLKFIDPSGLDEADPTTGFCAAEYTYEQCYGGGWGWGWDGGGGDGGGGIAASPQKPPAPDTPEGTGQPDWNDPWNEHIGLRQGMSLPGGGLGDLLGLPSGGCEFGVCAAPSSFGPGSWSSGAYPNGNDPSDLDLFGGFYDALKEAIFGKKPSAVCVQEATAFANKYDVASRKVPYGNISTGIDVARALRAKSLLDLTSAFYTSYAGDKALSDAAYASALRKCMSEGR